MYNIRENKHFNNLYPAYGYVNTDYSTMPAILMHDDHTVRYLSVTASFTDLRGVVDVGAVDVGAVNPFGNKCCSTQGSGNVSRWQTSDNYACSADWRPG
jgi:hypothetical protein